MSQPAARLGDATAHGGVVTSGNPTVLINGQPAAALGDLHVCPLCSPGPHVGGPVLAGAPTVLIGGKPAARVGDACTCAAPAPDVILSGSPNVLIGGASGAASPGVAAAVASAHGATASPGTPGLGTTARPLSPWVGVGYQDEAGRPVTGWHYRAEGERPRGGQLGTGGQVWLDALAESGSVEVGLVGVYGCRWARDEARVGEGVGMSARCAGVADGELALFEVWREAASADGAASRAKVWEVMGEVRGGCVEAAQPFVFEWADVSERAEADPAEAESPRGPAPASDSVAVPARPEADPETAWRGALPQRAGGPPVFVVEVSVGGVHRAKGGPLRHQDWVEVEVVGPDGRPVADAALDVVSASGEVRRGRTDGAGVARVDGVPPGPYTVTNVRP